MKQINTSYEMQRDCIGSIANGVLKEIPATWEFPLAKDVGSAIYGAQCAVEDAIPDPISMFLGDGDCRIGYGFFEEDVMTTLESLVVESIKDYGKTKVREILLPEMTRLVALLEERTRQPAEPKSELA